MSGESARRYFGTDGIRGAYGGPVVNEAFAGAFGVALGRWLRGAGVPAGIGAVDRPGAQGEVSGGAGAARPRVLIGRDTRASGASLAEAAARGLVSAGAVPVLLGVLPTPAVSRAVRQESAAAGLVLTASHNPSEDNGFKLFGSTGQKLSEGDEAAIEALLGATAPGDRSGRTGSRESAGPVGSSELARPVDDASSSKGSPEAGEAARLDYAAALAALLPAGALAGWSVVLDTANGATWQTSPEVMARLGARVDCLGNRPDGANINAGVGSEHPEALADRVRSTGARCGVAHDGDGDRCVLCDEGGGVLDGDEILAILATHALRTGTLSGGVVVATVQSNLGLDAAVEAAGGRVVRTPVGDRLVAERMRAEGAVLGGESSGHIIWSPAGPTGDGLAAALLVAGVMRDTGRPLSELRRVLRKFPQAVASLRVRDKRPLGGLMHLPAAIRALESELGLRGRVLVRYSGTEPKIRLLVEAPTEEAARSGLARLSEAVRLDLELIP